MSIRSGYYRSVGLGGIPVSLVINGIFVVPVLISCVFFNIVIPH